MNVKALFIAAFAAVAISAQAITGQNDGTITIKTSKTSKSLVEKWIDAYKQVNPNIKIELVSGKNTSADLTLVNNRQAEANVTYVGRYALLPITSAKNPLLSDIQKKEWKSKDIKSLFFVPEELDDEIDEETGKKNKLKDKLTVYSGSSKTSSTAVFASYFGRSIDDLRGQKIVGDDIYLLSAIDEDKAAVTFNSLNTLYDLQSRNLKDNVALLPLSIKKGQIDILSSGNLDEAIQLFEQENVDLVPVEEIGFTYSTFDNEIDAFLRWIVSDGQQYNHQQGFLRLSEKDAQNQLKELAHNN